MLNISMAVSTGPFGIHAGHSGIGHMVTRLAIGMDRLFCAFPGFKGQFHFPEKIEIDIFCAGNGLKGKFFHKIVGGMAFIAGKLGMG